MPKAISTSTTRSATDMEVTEHQFEYDGAGRMIVRLTTATGEIVTYTTSSAAMMRAVGLATQCINENLTPVFCDMLCKPIGLH